VGEKRLFTPFDMSMTLKEKSERGRMSAKRKSPGIRIEGTTVGGTRRDIKKAIPENQHLARAELERVSFQLRLRRGKKEIYLRAQHFSQYFKKGEP